MNTLDIIFLVLSSLGVAQGILLIIALLSKKHSKRKSNLYIALSILFVIYLILEFLFLRRTFNFNVPFYYSSRYGVWFLMGPLLLFYTQSLLKRDFSISKKVLHLLPFFVFTLLIPIFATGLIHKHSVTYGMLTLLIRNFNSVSAFNYLYSYIFVIQFIHAVLYFTITLRLIQKHILSIKSIHSNIENINLKWLKLLILAFIAIVSITVIFFILIITGTYYDRNMDYIYMLPQLIVIYMIAYQAIKQPELFNELNQTELITGQKYKDSTLSNEQSMTYKEQLLDYMRQSKPYQNSELKLHDLATTLEIIPRHLSQVINEQFQVNFYDFVNQYRIEEAKNLLQHKREFNILEVAFEVGFNNKTSFNNYFKKLIKMTPTQYRANFSN